MLKSTHRPPPPPTPDVPLPEGWTSHISPSGVPYFYNSSTSQSTYTRPAAAVEPSPALHYDPGPIFQHQQAQHHRQSRPRDYDRRNDHDRPKSKQAIPGCAPWVLVKTRLRRRFVHNPETGESFWKAPEGVLEGLLRFDIASNRPPEVKDEIVEEKEPEIVKPVEEEREELDDEYEEAEVTDDGEDEDENPAKRQRMDADADEPIAPPELGEDDMAYQLAQMGQMHHLDPGEYADGEDWEEGAEGLELSEAEVEASFMDLLADFGVSPYTTWDAVIDEGNIVDDYRYTLLPNTKTRKAVFSKWSSSKIANLTEERRNQAKRDPSIPYLAFLHKHATPKLYWSEFKRRFKKEPELKDVYMLDKDREKLYREHISRVTKSPEHALKADLRKLLSSIPASATWNRSTTLDANLPSGLLSDIRYISLKSSIRDAVILEHVASLPEATDIVEIDEESRAQKAERAKRDEALSQRQQRVNDDKRRQQRDLQHGRNRLQDEEEQLQRAMRVGNGALKAAVTDSDMADA